VDKTNIRPLDQDKFFSSKNYCWFDGGHFWKELSRSVKKGFSYLEILFDVSGAPKCSVMLKQPFVFQLHQ